MIDTAGNAVIDVVAGYGATATITFNIGSGNDDIDASTVTTNVR